MNIVIQFVALFFITAYLPMHAMDDKNVLKPTPCLAWNEPENIANPPKKTTFWEKPLLETQINNETIGIFLTECYCALASRSDSLQEISEEFAMFSGRIFAQALNNDVTREYAQGGLIDLSERGLGETVVKIAISLARAYKDPLTQQAVVIIETALLQESKRLVVDTDMPASSFSNIDLESPVAIDAVLTPSRLAIDLITLIDQIKNGNTQAICDGLAMIKQLFSPARGGTVAKNFSNGSVEENYLVALMIALLAKNQRKNSVIPPGALDCFSAANKTKLQIALKRASSGLNGGPLRSPSFMR